MTKLYNASAYNCVIVSKCDTGSSYNVVLVSVLLRDRRTGSNL